MKAYPAYKDSGLPWVEKIPDHWESLPNIAIFDERIERGFVNDELLSVTQNRGVIRQSELQEKKDISNEDKSAYKKVRIGDIAYNKMRMWQGAVGYSAFEGIISPAYVVLKPKRQLNPRFFHYLLRTPAYINESYRNSYGICDDQLSLRFFNFKRMYSIIPTLLEQDAIVAFLEAKEAEIQHFIDNQKRQIELLTDLTAISAERAVIQGIQEHVPLRSSGIPWLGNIPVHWSALRLKFAITRIEQGWSPQCDAQPAPPNRWGVLKVGCVNGDSFNEEENKTLPETLAPIPDLEIQSGDIMVSRANSRELVGSAALVEACRPKLMLCDKLFRFRARKQLALPKYIVLALRTSATRRQLEAEATGASSSMLNIAQSSLRNVWVPLPRLPEQERIVAFVEKLRREVSQNIVRVEAQLSRMEEYRTALISAAVTGKIDVRNA